MSREIKFRAWDGKKMVFFRFRDLKRVDEGLFAYVNDSSGRLICIDCDDNNHDIMQYTGLKDKNGKEIYEGDIVKRSRFFGSDVRYEGQVVFKDGCFIIEPEITIIHEYVFNAYQVEIIGNIYENHELLK